MEYSTVIEIIKKCIVTDLGCSSYKMDDDNLIFTCNSVTYVCVYVKNEPNYLRVVVPNIDSIEHITTTETYEKILRLNAKYKNVKFTIVNNSLWISSEIFLTGSDVITEAFVAMVKLLEIMRGEYAKILEKPASV